MPARHAWGRGTTRMRPCLVVFLLWSAFASASELTLLDDPPPAGRPARPVRRDTGAAMFVFGLMSGAGGGALMVTSSSVGSLFHGNLGLAVAMLLGGASLSLVGLANVIVGIVLIATSGPTPGPDLREARLVAPPLKPLALPVHVGTSFAF